MFIMLSVVLWMIVWQAFWSSAAPMGDTAATASVVPLNLPAFSASKVAELTRRHTVGLRVYMPDAFAPVATVAVGNASYKLIVSPDSFYTCLQPSSGYKGGQTTQYVHHFTTQSGKTRIDNVLLDDISIGGITASQTAVGLANYDFLADWNKAVHRNESIHVDGYLAFAPENTPGYNQDDPSLTPFATAAGTTMTLKYDAGWESQGGSLRFGGRHPSCWVQSLGGSSGYAISADINGIDIGVAFLYSGNFLSRVPENAAREIFLASGLKPEYEEEGGTMSVVAQVDCSVGHPMKVAFKDGGGTISIPGSNNMWRNDDKNGTCYSALRSSIDGITSLGYPLFRSAHVTYDGAGYGRVGFTQAKVDVSIQGHSNDGAKIGGMEGAEV